MKRLSITTFIVHILLIAFVLSPFFIVSYTCNIIKAEGDTEALKIKYTDVIELPDVSKDHYTFDGWFDQNGNKIKTLSKIMGNTDVTAAFSPNRYTLRYKDDSIIYDTYYADQNMELPKVEKEHYNFKGWDYQGKIITTTYGLYDDLTLIPVYEPKEYTIRLHPNGGKMQGSNIVKFMYGSKVTIESPLKDEYVFAGWYKDKNLSKPYNPKIDNTSDLDLYAAYKKIEPFPYMGSFGAIKVGTYTAGLDYSGVSYDDETYFAVMNSRTRAGVMHNDAGSLFVYDHNYDGFSQINTNDTLQIKFADGTIRTYHKTSTHYGHDEDWVAYDGIDIMEAKVPLITQTCTSGHGIVWIFWD